MTHLDKNADSGRKHERKSCSPNGSLTCHRTRGCRLVPKKSKKISPSKRNCSPRWAFGLLIRDFQLHAAVNDIAFKSVQGDDLLVAVTVTEILLGNRPEGISVHYGMNTIVLGRL